ncbi:S8 family serine peptidase [Laspinema sp. D1]|uniref:S8 family serine peptidase n=1 Tax=Laspinema palackyanum TaxID=3231601 RepID=UPI00347C5802|nr:S8 family serine peptidase [Laspinema sp. D2b]
MPLDGAYTHTQETFGIDPLLKGLENDPLFNPPSSSGYEPEEELPQGSGFDKDLVSNPNLYSTGINSDELGTSTTSILSGKVEASTVESDVDPLTKQPLKEEVNPLPDETDPLLNPAASAAVEEEVPSETTLDSEGVDEENDSRVDEPLGGDTDRETTSSVESDDENGVTDERDEIADNDSLGVTSETDEATEEEAEVTTDDTANSTDATVTEETDEIVSGDSLSETIDKSDMEAGDNTALGTGETEEAPEVATDDAADSQTEADEITATDETVFDGVVEEETTTGDTDDAADSQTEADEITATDETVSDRVVEEETTTEDVDDKESDRTENAVTQDTDEETSSELTSTDDTAGEDNTVGETAEIADSGDEETEIDGSGETEDNAGKDAATDEAGEDGADVVLDEAIATSEINFDMGTFKVDASGEVSIDFLFDGGAFKSQVAIVSLSGMEGLDPNSVEFIREAATRAASDSELGHIVIDDRNQGAKFTGRLGEGNFNFGTYEGVKTVTMRPGDEFFLMLVPNGTVQQVIDNPKAFGGIRPLFSLATANPNDEYHVGQIADLTGDGSAFAWEDLRFDGWTDKDYNDIVLQIRGAKGKAALMDDVVGEGKDWRNTDMGKKLIDYVTTSITPEEEINEGDPNANESDELSEESSDAVDIPTDEIAEDETEVVDSSTNPVDDSEDETEAIAEDSESEEPTDNIADETEEAEDSTETISEEESDEPTEAIADEEESDELTDNIADEEEDADEPTEAIADEEESESPSDGTDEVVDETIDEADNETEIVGDATDEVDETEVVKDVTDPADESEDPTDNIADDTESEDSTDNIADDTESDDSTDNIADDTEDSENTSPPPSVPAQPRFEFPKKDQPQIIVIDSDFSGNNPDLDYSQITWGGDYIEDDADPTLQAEESNGHGTRILGILAAKQDNSIGIDGINNQAPILASRAIGSGKWAEALIDAVDAAKTSGQPNAIVNLSFDLTQINPDGSVTTRTQLTPAERGALEYARQHNVLVVVSSGNQAGEISALGKASLEFDNVITVGAAKPVDTSSSSSPAQAYTRAEYSSYGQGLDIVADGGTPQNPVTSTEGNSTGTGFGTSVATAKVTGAASQVWAANPNLSYRQVIDVLKQTATDLNEPNWDAETGVGFLNMAAAVDLAQSTVPEPKRSLLGTGTLPDLKTPVLGSTQADDGILYLSNSAGQILRLDTETGEQRQVYQGLSFTDLAVAPSGKLYGSTFTTLSAIDPATGRETGVGRFPPGQSINALTFSPDGKLYGADSKTGKLFLIAPDTGKTVEIGSLGGPSSGDLLFNGSHQILATVKNGNRDQLVSVDITTGQSEIIGNLGFQNVYGLALLDGVLTAFTADGRKLEVDPRTGVATVVGLVSTAGQILGAADNPSSSGIWVGDLPEILEPGQVDPTRAPIPTERETNPTNPQAYQFQDSDRATWSNGVGEVPLWQYWDRPPQNVTNAFKWIYNNRYRGQFGNPSGPIRRRQIAGQWVWIQEFARGGSSNSRGIIIMRDSDRNRTNYENVAYGLVGKPLERWRIANMGLPTGNFHTASRSPRGTEGWWMPFERGSLHWTRTNNNSFALWQDYQAEYNRHGGSGGWLGFPTYEPYSWQRISGRNWEIAQFEGGFIVWGSGLGTFSFSWQDYNSGNGAIWNLFWNAVNAGLNRNQIQSLLNAYPPQRQWSTQLVGSLQPRSGPQGSGWVQEFNGPDGRRLLMLENGKNEAFWVLGDNYREYMEMGGPTGTLGFPRSNENRLNRSDGRYATWQAFSAHNGKSRIHHLGRSVATWGSIGNLYTDLNGAYHWLGMPTRREYIDGDTIFSDFEGGKIAYNRHDGRTEALRPGQQPSWRQPVGNPDIDIRLDFYGNFTWTQRNLIEQAAKNWENIITRDKVSSGVLQIAVTQGYRTMQGGSWGHWAEATWTEYSNQQKARPDLTTGGWSGNYPGEIRMHFNSGVLNTLSQNQLIRLTMHEMGHALGLDEAQYDSSLGMDGIMDSFGLDPKITFGVYNRLEWMGYSVNRNASVNWG